MHTDVSLLSRKTFQIEPTKRADICIHTCTQKSNFNNHRLISLSIHVNVYEREHTKIQDMGHYNNYNYCTLCYNVQLFSYCTRA